MMHVQPHEPLCRLFDPHAGGACECYTIRRVRRAMNESLGVIDRRRSLELLLLVKQHVDAAVAILSAEDGLAEGGTDAV